MLPLGGSYERLKGGHSMLHFLISNWTIILYILLGIMSFAAIRFIVNFTLELRKDFALTAFLKEEEKKNKRFMRVATVKPTTEQLMFMSEREYVELNKRKELKKKARRAKLGKLNISNIFKRNSKNLKNLKNL